VGVGHGRTRRPARARPGARRDGVRRPARGHGPGRARRPDPRRGVRHRRPAERSRPAVRVGLRERDRRRRAGAGTRIAGPAEQPRPARDPAGLAAGHRAHPAPRARLELRGGRACRRAVLRGQRRHLPQVPRRRVMHVHILGIGGTFMAGIASLARSLGHRVTGTDRALYPPMSTQLAQLGIEIIEGYDNDRLEPAPDCVIVGNVMSRGMPVVERLLDSGLAYSSGPEWLAREVLRDRWTLAVAGTHGKTTTTTIL